MTPAKEVGGDLYDFLIRDNCLYFCIGDVSGKGIPAALVMAVTRNLFRTLANEEQNPNGSWHASTLPYVTIMRQDGLSR